MSGGALAEEKAADLHVKRGAEKVLFNITIVIALLFRRLEVLALLL